MNFLTISVSFLSPARKPLPVHALPWKSHSPNTVFVLAFSADFDEFSQYTRANENKSK